jgi:hypothetical protein
MSIDTIERDLAQYLAHSDYSVSFRHAESHDFFYVFVFYGRSKIAEKSFHGRRGTYRRGAKWAKKQIAEHEAMMRDLAGLVRYPL